MRKTERELDRILTRLRNVIRQQGFTQTEVQETLGWGRSYISQLLTKQKALRVEQVLMILNVVNVDAAKFWGDIYGLGERPEDGAPAVEPGAVDGELHRLGELYEALVDALRQKDLLTAEELASAIKKARAMDLV